MLRTIRQVDRSLLILLGFAFALRCVVVFVRWDNLSIDRDAYLAIAENLMDGNGFCSVPGRPTAFRPPLYPLLLAACLSIGGMVAVAAVQIGLGTATVGLTWRLTCNAGFSERTGLIAGLLVAVDPLLLELTSQPMTETLFVFLVAALLCSLTRTGGLSLERPLLSGLLIGLAALCRPSIWAFVLLSVALAIAWRLLQQFLRAASRESKTSSSALAPTLSAIKEFRRVGLLGIATAIVVCPWVLRNQAVFGRPILMTTHGGYTLALGNNEVFHADVVSGRESVWSAKGLRSWQRESEQLIAEAGVSRSDELAHDAALSRQAVDWIRQNPKAFAETCWLRLTRFWAIRPLRADVGSEAVRNVIGVWYGAVLTAAFVGFARHVRCNAALGPSLLLVVSLTLLHSVYWSNMRMRAPVVSVIGLLAASSIVSDRRSEVLSDV